MLLNCGVRLTKSLSMNVLKIPIKSNCSNTSFRTSVALLIFCLEDLSTDVSEVLKSLLLYSDPFLPLGLLVFVFYISVQFSCCWVVSDSLWPHGLQHARLLCPWNSPGRNTGVGSRSLLQGIFPTQEWNPRLLHCRQILYCWATREAHFWG